jgi:hypothetical protein
MLLKSTFFYAFYPYFATVSRVENKGRTELSCGLFCENISISRYFLRKIVYNAQGTMDKWDTLC